MADGVKEALYVRGVLVFLMPSPGSPSIGVFEDNKGAMDLTKNPLSSSNSKHIDVRSVFCVSWWGRETCRLSISERKIVTKAIVKESYEKHHDFILGI